jgi:hypothetical protein
MVVYLTRLERCGPCPNVEIEAHGDSRSTYESDHSLVGLWGLSCQYKRFCLALAALVGPEQVFFQEFFFKEKVSYNKSIVFILSES